MERFSLASLIRHSLSGHTGWKPFWRDAAPKQKYDAIIIGGGGHGLATAYYLAKNHGITNVAVLEKGWIGGGNTGRNTTIIRSNYMLDDNAHFYEWSLKLWHQLSREINYNVMFSPRGVLNLAHTEAQRDQYFRRGNQMLLNGIDAEWMTREEIARLVPHLDCSDHPRHPIFGGLMQRRGGTARHDAVAWGYARAASALGVDIIQNCEVQGFIREGNRIVALQTSRGRIGAGQVGIAVAGHTGTVAGLAGLKLPIESHVLQAFVSEPLKPILDTAEKLGVNVGIECEPGLYLEYVAELREWIDKLNHPRFGANLDIGHSQVIGESIPEVVAMLEGRIWNLHVEDIPGRKHYHMIPGEGTLDWLSLKNALAVIQYDRFLTVELYTHTADPQHAAEASFKFLDKHFGGT